MPYMDPMGTNLPRHSNMSSISFLPIFIRRSLILWMAGHPYAEGPWLWSQYSRGGWAKETDSQRMALTPWVVGKKMMSCGLTQIFACLICMRSMYEGKSREQPKLLVVLSLRKLHSLTPYTRKAWIS